MPADIGKSALTWRLSALPEMVDRLPDDVDARRSRVSSSRNAAATDDDDDDDAPPPPRRLVSELTEAAAGRDEESLRPRGQRIVSTTSPPSIARSVRRTLKLDIQQTTEGDRMCQDAKILPRTSDRTQQHF